MNWNFFKKETSTIEFFSLIPEVVDIAPIKPANQFRPNLIENATKELSEFKKNPNYEFTRNIHTAKCPGIYNVVKHGWVMTTWQDIVIETNGDGINFKWATPTSQNGLTNGKLVGWDVSFHSSNQYTDYVGQRANTLANVVKIMTPWRCIVPKGYYLQEGPLPYTDEERFTTVKGFFSREHGVAQMNVQLLWHVMNGKTLIKAGTPIAHYTLVPKNLPKLLVTKATDAQIYADQITNVELSKKFNSEKSASKCFFSQFYK